MNCSIQGCPGRYEDRRIVHTIRHGNDLMVVENVPADVCDVCADVLLAPDTIRHLEKLVRDRVEPEKFAPVYDYV
jgi:YgiT-type zinc finger domain-containing protein